MIRSDLDTRVSSSCSPMRPKCWPARPCRSCWRQRTRAGVLKRFASAMNARIEPFLHTSPLSRVMDVVDGGRGKAQCFVRRRWKGESLKKSDSANFLNNADLVLSEYLIIFQPGGPANDS